jgi:hypothetical protein
LNGERVDPHHSPVSANMALHYDPLKAEKSQRDEVMKNESVMRSRREPEQDESDRLLARRCWVDVIDEPRREHRLRTSD